MAAQGVNMASGAGSIYVKVEGVRKVEADLGYLITKTERKIYVGLVAALLTVEAEAKRKITSGYYKPAIDTGRMRNSLTTKVDKFSSSEITGIVGTSVYYAIYVHEGVGGGKDSGWKMAPRPFLLDAAKAKEKEVERILDKAIRAAL